MQSIKSTITNQNIVEDRFPTTYTLIIVNCY